MQYGGYSYPVVEIGCQCWFAENLRTTTYANGELIPSAVTYEEWESATGAATAVYGDGDSLCFHGAEFDACVPALSLAEYGRLYNWYAVDDSQGLCPTGWHVPTRQEWIELENFITCQGFEGTEGTALKSTSGWYNDGNGTDDFGFSALPGGIRDNDITDFINAGAAGYWWSANEYSDDNSEAWGRGLVFEWTYTGEDVFWKDEGMSVRCLKDSE